MTRARIESGSRAVTVNRPDRSRSPMRGPDPGHDDAGGADLGPVRRAGQPAGVGMHLQQVADGVLGARRGRRAAGQRPWPGRRASTTRPGRGTALGSLVASPAAPATVSSMPARSTITAVGEYDGSKPTIEASCQSAAAVNVDSRSPRPDRVIASGEADRTSESMTSASGQRLGVVRLVPLRSRTDWSSAYPLTLAAVWTTTWARSRRFATTLPMSANVPEPTVTRAPGDNARTPSAARSSVASSACTPGLAGPSGLGNVTRLDRRSAADRLLDDVQHVAVATRLRHVVGEDGNDGRLCDGQPGENRWQQGDRARSAHHLTQTDRLQLVGLSRPADQCADGGEVVDLDQRGARHASAPSTPSNRRR